MDFSVDFFWGQKTLVDSCVDLRVDFFVDFSVLHDVAVDFFVDIGDFTAMNFFLITMLIMWLKVMKLQ